MTSDTSSRYFLPSLSELIDRLTVSQIKLNLLLENSDDFSREISNIIHDINLIIQQKNISCSGELVHAIIMISQINLHIWQKKESMQENLKNELEYLKYLKKAHQMNGVRNLLKNYILNLEGISDASQIRSNFEVDGLQWKIH